MLHFINIGNFHLPTYMVVISSIFCLGVFWIPARAKKYDLNTQTSLDILLATMVGGFIGARLLHVVYEMPLYYLDNPLEIFKFWQGGFVFYGAAFVGFFAGAAVVYFKKESIRQWSDFYSAFVALAYALGRLACFLNGCCYGKICDLPWAIQFPNLAMPRHPTQLYAFFIETIFALILFYAYPRRAKFKLQLGQIFYVWIFFHGIGRIFMESLRSDERGPVYLLTLSTWISILLMIIAVAGFYMTKKEDTQYV